MNNHLKEQLEKYLQAEADSIRHILILELDTFISMLLESEINEYKDWVYELSRQVIDQEKEFPIRMPLFEKIIFPVLYEGFESNTPNSARYLAGYSQFIYESKPVRRKLGEEFSEEYFLRKAIEHDATDEKSKEKLITLTAFELGYSIHEVPSGVLWCNKKASIEECDKLAMALAEFENMVAGKSSFIEYEPLINECLFHFTEYKKYLVSEDSHESYSAYLSATKK